MAIVARILIDMSQFSGWPARTGIQRVLKEMLSYWPSHIVAADIGVQVAEGYRVLPLGKVSGFLDRLFRGDIPDNSEAALKQAMSSFVDTATDKSVSFDDLFNLYDGYFLPEPTFRDDVLSVLARWQKLREADSFVLLYDALLQTNPEVYGAPHQLATSRYFRLVARSENVACISRATQQCLEQRLRRKPAPRSLVLDLGADSLGGGRRRRVSQTPTFVMMGTVEPRKKQDIVLEAFDGLWNAGHDYRLIIIGSAGWYETEFIQKLRGRANEGKRLVWLETARDEDISEAMGTATAAIYVSELEGYGLPAVEALASGCPLIAAENLPALAGLPSKGQIRLSSVTAETVAAAVQHAATPSRSEKLSLELAELELPKWPQFAHSLAEWIGGTLEASRQSPSLTG